MSKSTQEVLDEYKQQVREVAERLAEQHGWCDVVEDALTELGIPKAYKVGDKIDGGLTHRLPIGAHIQSKGGGSEIFKSGADTWRRVEDGESALPNDLLWYFIKYLPESK